MKILALVFLLGALAAWPAAAADPAPSVDTPIFATFYYTWYGNPEHDGKWRHWNEYGRQPPADIASDYYPYLGLYSVQDEAVVDQQMTWIAEAGLDLVVLTWKGRGHYTDNVSLPIMDVADRHGLKVTFHIETYKSRSPETLAGDVAYIYDRFGGHPAFFRTRRGSPHSPGDQERGFFFLWDPDFKYNPGPKNDGSYWREAVDQVHALPGGTILLASSMDPDFIDQGHFDGGFSYLNRGTMSTYRSDQFFFWVQQMPRDSWYVPSVTPGYACRRIGYPHTANMSRDQGRTYDGQWREVLNTGVIPPMITVTTFNEWHEGTNIEPAVCWKDDGLEFEYECFTMGPFQYLLATETWTETFRRLPDPAAAHSVSLDLGPQNVSRGLYQRDLNDGITEGWTEGHRSGRRTHPHDENEYRFIYLWVSDDFHRGTEADMMLRVEFRDDGPGMLTVDYHSTVGTRGGPPAYREGPVIALEGTGEWRSVVVDLPSAVLDNGQHRGADLRIGGRFDFLIGRVTLVRK